VPGFIYLASKSPRRAELLRQLGVSFTLLDADANEDVEALEVLVAGESARHYVQRVTAQKAAAALVRMRRRGLVSAPILAADTTVAIGRLILGKPGDRHAARDMLERLSGTTHRVLTAVAVTQGRRLELALSESRVRMDRLSRGQITSYIDSGEPFGKAGGYALQGRGARFVRHISGSPSGIVGLPLFETALLLGHFGVAFAAGPSGASEEALTIRK